MLKTINCIIIFSLFSFLIKAQTSVDKRIIEAFGEEKVLLLQENNPEKLLYYHFFLENAFFFSQPKEKSVQKAIDIRSLYYVNDKTRIFDEDIESLNQKSFNPLKYSIKRSYAAYTHYKLGESGRYIIFKPIEIFEKEFEDYKKLLE